MKTVRRLLHGEILLAVTFVAASFLALFGFFDLVSELQELNRYAAQGYQLQHALLYIGLKVPVHLYELLPISVLIGTILVMARLAQSSEFTILRTGGLDPLRALGSLMSLGLIFVTLTFLNGDYLAPWADRQAIQLKGPFQGRLTIGQTGAWLKETQGTRHFAVNVRSFDGLAHMENIRIHEFNVQGQLQSITTAAQGVIQNNAWLLKDGERKTISHVEASHQLSFKSERVVEQLWPTHISTDMVAAALLSPERMRIVDLFQYIRHLSQNKQNAQAYEIEFWRKVFYPLSCLVMLVLAMPFAYLHFRSGQIAGHVFLGVLAGISFTLLSNLFGFVGNLHNWQPWLTSAAPALIYSAISLGAFWWMVLRR
ncbi:LPS export ABC transporter permease LptG [Limnohabitans sp. T6-5]|uniref:LPS export ABC transporter permease LptG n=1 Tax=Limnohabitans sp. T6-5 TaxID=1100724 RepID=UPI000D338938|nr:LPS export ABC transporter permease LptG [Limnohabitans sp. T6-5]PUE08571.1 LPS export ABC transporter permease LptG [Limnohabitans sp. T6-5]